MNSTIKTWIAVVIFIVLTATCFYGIFATKKATLANCYAVAGYVTEINRNWGYTAVKDYEGKRWFLYDCNNWALGDLVGLCVNGHGTETIADDTIVNATYWGTGK